MKEALCSLTGRAVKLKRVYTKTVLWYPKIFMELNNIELLKLLMDVNRESKLYGCCMKELKKCIYGNRSFENSGSRLEQGLP